MKKIFFAFGLYTLFSAHAFAQTYVWEHAYEPLKTNKVKFQDGSEILIKEEKNQEVEGRTLFIKQGSKKEFVKTRHTDDHVHVSAAYPSSDNAIVAVFSLSCAGNACHGSNIVVAYIHQNKLVINELDAVFNPEARLTFNIRDKELTQAEAIYLDVGEIDKLGDSILRKRSLLLGKGFIDSRFRSSFISLINVHPSKFFEDKNARSKLLNKIDSKAFKELRDSISVAFNTDVHMGRYVTFAGCMAHNCYDVNGIVVLDGFDGETWALNADKERKLSKFYGTKPLNLNVEYLMRNEFASQYELEIARKTNGLIVKFNNPK